MSPPQVSLGVKPTPVVSEEDMPMEVKVKSDVDSIITFESKGKFSRRCRIICLIAVLTVVAGTVAVILGMIFGLRHHDDEPIYFCGTPDYPIDYPDDYEEKNCTSWSCLYGEHRIIENVWVDENLQLIHAEHAHGSHEEPSMHVLQDYRNGKAAYKDTERNICFITDLQETFQEGLNRWHSYERTGRNPKTLRLLSHFSIQSDEVRLSAGVPIFNHCSNASSFWAEEIEEMNVTSSMTIVKV